MRNKVIITCAVTGAADTTTKNSQVPVTPKEIAEAAIDSAREGAAVAHIHVRDPQTGGISHDTGLFREVAERVRSSETDVILNFTAGGGGDWFPDTEDPTRGGPGTDIQAPEERHAPVGELLPEICSLDCGSYNFGDEGIYVSPAHWLRKQAALIQKSGVRAELECFDLGHIRMARQLINEGLIDGDPLFQICLGIPWGAEADTETMLTMRNKLPSNAHWAAFGIGRMQMPMVAQSALLGGNVRVGLEDNIYLKKGVPANNRQLVEKAISMLGKMNIEPMTPEEARDHLGLINPAKGVNKYETAR